jgi:hypothetical protein
MKKLFIIILAVVIYSCNDPKDPPDEGMSLKVQQDSIVKVDSLNKQ